MFECFPNTTPVMDSSELSPPTLSSPSQAPRNDPLLLNVYNNGHKVVAYPGIMPSKSTDAAVGGGSKSSNFTMHALKRPNGKPRSMSAGRARPSGRDLVKDVYERLGVERPDTSSPGSPSGRGRTAAACSPGLSTAEDQRRARSLSRGRMRNRWPPSSSKEGAAPTSPPRTKAVRGASEAAGATAEPASPVSPNARVFRRTDDSPASPVSPRTYKTTAVATVHRREQDFMNEAAASMTNSKSLEWRRADHEEAKEGVIPRAMQASQSMEWRDEKKESHDYPFAEGEPTSPVSIKDRMRLFGDDSSRKAAASNVSRRPVDKQYAAQFAVREHPPKIDIYEGGKNLCLADSAPSFDEKKSDESESADRNHRAYNAPKKSAIEAGSVKSYPLSPVKTKAGMANAYLAAIQSPNSTASSQRKLFVGRTYAPVSEVVSGAEGDHASETENVSLLSANSEDQSSPYAGHRGTRKSWNRVPAYTPGSSQYLHTSPSQQQRGTFGNTINEAAIEKMVDDRVRARVENLERSMVDQLQTFMTRMEERMEARVGRLEALLREQQR